MATRPVTPPGDGKPLIVASMFGVTTPCVTVARERLEELGYEVLVFHQVGLGGQSLEEVVKMAGVAGVLDVTTGGLADEIGGGIWPDGPERIQTAGRLGIPQVVSLGGLDFVTIGPPEPLPARFAGRTLYIHDNVLAATRPTPGGEPAGCGGPRAQAERRHRADGAVRAAARCLAALDRGGGARTTPRRTRRCSPACASSSMMRGSRCTRSMRRSTIHSSHLRWRTACTSSSPSDRDRAAP